MQCAAGHTCRQAAQLLLAQRNAFAYNSFQQHPPRIPLDLRTMGGYFFPGAVK